MITVCVLRNYSYPDLKRQTPGNTGVWNNVKFVFHPVDECDYLVMFNYPEQDIKIKVREGGAWLFVQEPPGERNEYLKRYFPYFDKVISGFESKNEKFIKQQALLPWHVEKSYDELKSIHPEHISRKNEVSWVTSTINKHPGHRVRLKFLDYLQKHSSPVKLYGRGIHPVNSKWDVTAEGKYAIAVENYRGESYWTEKLIDPMLAWSIPFYYGCTNISEFFPQGSYIELDITDPAAALEKIEYYVNSNYWEKNIDALRSAREKILDEYQLFPAVVKMIEEDKNNPEKFRVFKMPAYPMSANEKMRALFHKFLGSKK